MNNKIKVGFINVGVIGVTIVGGYLYGQVQYIRGILDTTKELKEGVRKGSRSYSNYYKNREEEEA